MFTVADKLGINWVALSGQILSSSRYGREYDRLKVIQEIGLASPLAQDETFLIPPAGKTIDVKMTFPDGNIINFAGQRYKDIQDELNSYGEAVKTQNIAEMERIHKMLLNTAMLSPVVFNTGTQVITFEYELGIYPGPDNIFEVNIWAPMPTFSIQGGGQVTTTIMIPSNSNPFTRATLIEAKGFQADESGNLQQEIAPVVSQNCGLRHLLGWHWQNDPFFKVRYQYV